MIYFLKKKILIKICFLNINTYIHINKLFIINITTELIILKKGKYIQIIKKETRQITKINVKKNRIIKIKK